MSLTDKLETAQLIQRAASNAAALKEAQPSNASDVWKLSAAGFGSVEALAAATGVSVPGLDAAQKARAIADEALAAIEDPVARAKALAEEQARQQVMGLLAGAVLESFAPDLPTPGLPEPTLPSAPAPNLQPPGATPPSATPPNLQPPGPTPPSEPALPDAAAAGGDSPGLAEEDGEASLAQAEEPAPPPLLTPPRAKKKPAPQEPKPKPKRRRWLEDDDLEDRVRDPEPEPPPDKPPPDPPDPKGKHGGPTQRALAALAAAGKNVGLAALSQVGAVFEAATELEKYLSGPFVAIPFPCFPALRCWDMEVGFPHAHTHPPNLIPPAPPIPLPSTGPVLKIPFLSGADQTFINAVHASCCGDMGLGIWCGGFFPLFEVKFGSASVWIEGSRAARQLVDVTIHCFPSKPTGKDIPIGGSLGMTLAGSPNVMIGGVPMPSLMDLGFGAMFKVLGKAMKGLKKVANVLGKTKAGKAVNAARRRAGDWVRRVFRVKKGSRVSKAICFFSGHPVNVANGSVLAFAEDFELPGQLPLQWKRDWYSTSEREGLLGHGWHHPYDFALVVDKGGDNSVCPPQDIVGMRLDDGRTVLFPEFDAQGEAFERTERLTLFHDERGYGVRTSEHLTYRFTEPAGSDAVRELASIEDPSGARITFLRDARQRLTRILDSAGRILKVETDSAGRITRITAPNPVQEGQWQQMVAYRYSDEGDLMEVQDALGQRQRYRYEGHLLQEERDRNGLGFYFEYHGKGVDARCTRTWGDESLYDHKMVYASGKTQVTNSLGEVSYYFLSEQGLVTSQQDPCGGVTQYEYNEHNQETAQMDPLGRTTASVFDERGNLVEATAADGAKVSLRYDERDDLVAATDALGGTWTWAYDDQHRLTERTDPLGTTTRYEYRGRYLGALVDAAGRRTRFDYDAYGNLIQVTLPDGTTTQWEVDALGRPTSVTDALGNVQHLTYDVMGRVREVREPDGNRRAFGYDAEGNVVHAKDRQRDVHFRYRGMGRMVERSEAGVTVKFEYDTEEQLTAICNQHGRVYQFELDGNGDVLTETGFDGVRRVYERDAAGQVTKLVRASGLESAYQYDDAGRVLNIEHSDGSREAYEYRADGALLLADNGCAAGPVRFERDALGRIEREWQGEHWVASQYDVLGLRCRMHSSLGAMQDIERDLMGDVRRVAYGEQPPEPVAPGEAASEADRPQSVEALWEARFERDRLGLELQRSLPGGVQSRWKRDKLGRPIQHQVVHGVGAGGTKTPASRDVKYTWDVNGRLRQMLNAHKGLIRFDHDAVGNLAAVNYADGTVDLRLPDAVGNLFRTLDKQDRKYGPAGQLLERRSEAGVTHYEYDAEGNLVRKREPGGGVWEYRWNAAGMLREVLRPDGQTVSFEYDALGRRTEKRFAGKVTHWVWDGNNPLHEWITHEAIEEALGVEGAPAAPDAPPPMAGVYKAHPPTGPPAEEERGGDGTDRSEVGGIAEPLGGVAGNASSAQRAPEGLITWLFEPESFAPLAKIVGSERQSIVCDHLGTPVAMYDAQGERVWAAELTGYGEIREADVGARGDCPFRYPGQYEDAETGLYYNRFRYYDPEAGAYVSQDPIGLAGGAALYRYVGDPTGWVDPFGLAKGKGVPHGDVTPIKFKGRSVYALLPDVRGGNYRSWQRMRVGYIKRKRPPKALRERIRANAGRVRDGRYRDTNTGRALSPEDTDYGHAPGFEFAHWRDIAESEGWTQKMFDDFYNDASKWQLEHYSSNRSRQWDYVKRGKAYTTAELRDLREAALCDVFS